jgi:hypothetical protein
MPRLGEQPVSRVDNMRLGGRSRSWEGRGREQSALSATTVPRAQVSRTHAAAEPPTPTPPTDASTRCEWSLNLQDGSPVTRDFRRSHKTTLCSSQCVRAHPLAPEHRRRAVQCSVDLGCLECSTCPGCRYAADIAGAAGAAQMGLLESAQSESDATNLLTVSAGALSHKRSRRHVSRLRPA